MSNSEIYDALAPFYREYADKRAPYIEAIDRLIDQYIPKNAKTLLDVGAGDGVRGMALARRNNIAEAVLCDSSSEMVKRCESLSPSEVWRSPAEKLPNTERRFDVIVSLWNVLGHIAPRSARVAALSEMKRLLKPGGRVFIDVNNRHNIPSYGFFTVVGRILVDNLLPDERRGDASFDWKIGEKTFPARGHLFTPSEIQSIITESGLKIERRLAVNYSNGKVSPYSICGQLFYVLS